MDTGTKIVKLFEKPVEAHSSRQPAARSVASNKFTTEWQAHQRLISGLTWNGFDGNYLASCSPDNEITIWDLREPRKGAQRFKSFVSWNDGASQVKWNRRNPNIFASAHGGEVRVWDIRKDSTPLTFITAHNTKINGLDWSYAAEHDLVTCGQDRKIKFWNTTQPRVTKATIKTKISALRARLLPVGQGLVTMAQKEDHKLKLWRLSDLSSPIYNFEGHTDLVTVFDYRVRSSNGSWSSGAGTNFDPNDRDVVFQIISWSKDNTMRMWSIHPDYMRMCGHMNSSNHFYPRHMLQSRSIFQQQDASSSIGSSPLSLVKQKLQDQLEDCIQQTSLPIVEDDPLLSLSPSSSTSLSFSPSSPSPSSSSSSPSASPLKRTLQHQFATIQSHLQNLNIPGLDVTLVDDQRKTYDILWRFGKLLPTNSEDTVHLCVSLPLSPSSIPFESSSDLQFISKDSTLRPNHQTVLRNDLINLMRDQSSQLTPLNFLFVFLSQLTNLLFVEDILSHLGPGVSSSLDDDNSSQSSHQKRLLPCPRLSGATFTSDGKLLLFSNLLGLSTDASLPTTYDRLPDFLNRISRSSDAPISNEDDQSVESFYFAVCFLFFFS